MKLKALSCHGTIVMSDTYLFTFRGSLIVCTYVVRIVLEKMKSSCSPKEFSSIVNYKRTSTTIKWKGIYLVARTLYRAGLTNTGVLHSLASDSGSSALNLAVRRGDVEIVKILLENGADPYVENDLGMNAFDICNKAGPFPSVNRALQEHVNEE